MVVVLGADLTVVEPVVGRTNIIYDQTPLVGPLTIVDADTTIADECKQTDCQRMNVIMTTPRDLQIRHVTRFMSRPSRDRNERSARGCGRMYLSYAGLDEYSYVRHLMR